MDITHSTKSTIPLSTNVFVSISLKDVTCSYVFKYSSTMGCSAIGIPFLKLNQIDLHSRWKCVKCILYILYIRYIVYLKINLTIYYRKCSYTSQLCALVLKQYFMCLTQNKIGTSIIWKKKIDREDRKTNSQQSMTEL